MIDTHFFLLQTDSILFFSLWEFIDSLFIVMSLKHHRLTKTKKLHLMQQLSFKLSSQYRGSYHISCHSKYQSIYDGLKTKCLAVLKHKLESTSTTQLKDDLNNEILNIRFSLKPLSLYHGEVYIESGYDASTTDFLFRAYVRELILSMKHQQLLTRLFNCRFEVTRVNSMALVAQAV